MKRKLIFVIILIIVICCTLIACEGKSNNEEDKGTYTIQYYNDNEVITLKVNYGSTYSITEIPNKTGYMFSGLYDAETGGTQYVNSKGVSVSTFTDKKNLTLYAQFVPKTYNLIFDYCGADVEFEKCREVEYDSSLNMFPQNLSKGNSVFAGWYTKPNCGGTQITDAYDFLAGKSILNSQNYGIAKKDYYDKEITSVTLYAGFKYKLEFYSNGGSQVNNIIAPYGEYIQLPSPTMNGMAFGGWFDDNGKIFDTNTMPEESKYLTAKWLNPTDIVADFKRMSSKNDCGYDINNPETDANWISRHNGWELGEIVLSGVGKNELNKYSIPVDGKLSISYRLLQDPNSLPISQSGVSHLKLGDDKWTGAISGTSIKGSIIGKGAYWMEVTYTDNSTEEIWQTNFLYGKNKGDMVDMNLPLGAVNKKIKTIEIKLIYELYCDGPGFMGFYWYEYPNWCILVNLQFI